MHDIEFQNKKKKLPCRHLHPHFIILMIFKTHVSQSISIFGCCTVAPELIDVSRAPTNPTAASLTPAREADLFRMRVTLKICQKFLLGVERNPGGVPEGRKPGSHYHVV